MLAECYRLFWFGMFIGIACGIVFDILFDAFMSAFRSHPSDYTAHEIERFREEIEHDEIHTI